MINDFIKKIYGNSQTLLILDRMNQSNRLPHAILLWGEIGAGKKTIAQNFAMKMLCENSSSKPCFECRTCKNILNSVHPDIITVEKSGIKQGFSVETVKKIAVDANITPNNGDKKIYLFQDCDNISVQAQNTLLKIIEEPPDFTYFIFTATNKQCFLDTVLSRVISVSVSPCSFLECEEALTERGYSSSQISDSMSCFGGNIGKCVEYLENSSLKEMVDMTKQICDAISLSDEYSLLKALHQVESDRFLAKKVLEMADKFVRDTLVTKHSSQNQIGCYPSCAMSLSSRISTVKCVKIHEEISRAYNEIDGNINLKIMLPALCGNIMNIIQE